MARCLYCGKREHPTEVSRLRCRVRIAEQRLMAAKMKLSEAERPMREAAKRAKHAAWREKYRQPAEYRRWAQLANKLVAKARSCEHIGQPHEAAACKAKVRELVAGHGLHAWFKPGLSWGRHSLSPRIEYEPHAPPRGEHPDAITRRMLAEHEAWLAA